MNKYLQVISEVINFVAAVHLELSFFNEFLSDVNYF